MVSASFGFHQDRGEFVASSVNAQVLTVTFPALTDVDPVASVDGTVVAAEIHRSATRTSTTVHDVPVTATLRIGVGARPRPRRNDVDGLLFRLLDRAQIEYRTNTQVLDIATADRPRAVRLSHLQALDLDAALFTAVGEILLAQSPQED
jgi:hypothetical protein